MQVAQKMLYSIGMCWTDTVKALLHKIDVLKYDLYLFLINLAQIDLRDVGNMDFQVKRDFSYSGKTMNLFLKILYIKQKFFIQKKHLEINDKS